MSSNSWSELFYRKGIRLLPEKWQKYVESDDDYFYD